ncbi:NLR family CARD domain-containing protein 4-like isoform X2 [Mizuhopecten yessoensis]|uniref:NLR family CARD domain-containing protein 4 n=1 Tax=Mizuhopecten yessoensis TaxID=6573 RepID=A0A210PUW5_MIZYE|nr:NLR family CARD domain-containing protein 4-like isoform X2 [Mizuhopecten yessoensis]OWF40290.1 NLR family CARD domain-containing protein 4 [Mizuhopecten yessoensis]
MDAVKPPDIEITAPEPVVAPEVPQPSDSFQEKPPETANMDPAWASKFNNSSKEREYLARTAWLLLDAGTSALRTVFDSVHPPLNLRDHLAQAHVRSVLVRLHEEQKVLTDNQWKLLYPLKKKHVLSQKYDSHLLLTLLQSVCHLCPPYPNGWHALPMSTDSSLAADIVRMQLLYQQVASMESMAIDEYTRIWRQASEVLFRLGGPPIRVKIHRIEHEVMTPEMQTHYITTFMTAWGDGRKLISSPKSADSLRRARRNRQAKHSNDQNGLSPEDKAVWRKVHKMLVDNIVADDLLDRLQQNQVIKFSDRQEILSITKNSERMVNLLNKILNSKNSTAFKALLEAMKYKYKKIHEEVVQIRKETYKNGVRDNVDVVGVVSEVLCNHYKQNYNKCQPFPWNESVTVNIRDIYTPLDILNSDGKRLHLHDFCPPPTTNGRGPRVMLEGASGSGKSVLCQTVSYLWGSQKSFFRHRYPIFLHVDLQTMEGGFYESLYERLIPAGFSLDLSGFRSMLEEHSYDVMLLVDGYDDGSDVPELKTILSGESLRLATVIVAANPELISSGHFTPDSKMFCMGFSQTNAIKCVTNFLEQFKANIEHHEDFLGIMANEKWALRPYLNLPIVVLLVFGYYQTTKKPKLLEIETVTGLFESYGISMAMHLCKKQKIDVIGYEFPEDIITGVEKLGNFAFNTLLSNRKAFGEDELTLEIENPNAFKLCAFSKFMLGSKVKFLCGLMQDFLAAKHLADFVMDDIVKTIKDNGMTKKPKFTQVVSLLSGLYRFDYDTSVLRAIFTELAVRNIRQTRVPTGHDTETSSSEKKLRPPSGQIMDFNTSLQSLIECQSRDDVCKIVAQSLPPNILVRREGLIPSKCLYALQNVLRFEDNRLTHLEFHLQPMYMYQQSQFNDIAIAAARNKNLTSLKVQWSSLDLMSKFMCTFMTETDHIEHVTLEDVCRKPLTTVPASTWAALQTTCENMSKASRVSFINSKVAAVTYFVLQHLPHSVEELDLHGCAMNMMCSSEISGKLEKSTTLEKLDLTGAHLSGSEFVPILQGLKLCSTIKHLKMCGAKLDRLAVDALSECLKLTRSLQVLDLSECQLTTDMCQKLAGAIVQNRTLQRLVLKKTKVTSEGREAISHTKLDQVKVVGLDENVHVVNAM